MEIKSRFDGKALFSFETDSLKVAVEAAIKIGASLRGADLRGADLRRANIGGAYLGSAYLGGAYLGGANLRGAYLGGADLRRAYLRRADLRHANIGGADLGGADLRGAYLGGAKLADDIRINEHPIQLLGLRYDVFIFDEHIKIGCELHSMAEWFSFDDERINKMNSSAVESWRQWKEPLKQICISSGRYKGKGEDNG